MKIFGVLALVMVFAAVGFCLFRRAKIQHGIHAIESMGGAVSVHETSLGGPTRVSLKLEGVPSNANDQNILLNASALRGLSSVRRLKAGDSPLGDAGFKLLLEWWGSSLEHVDISETKVSSNGVTMAFSCPSLKELLVSAEQIDSGIMDSVEQRPELNVIVSGKKQINEAGDDRL